MKTIKLMLTIMASLVASQLSAAEGDGPNLDLEHALTEKKALIEEYLPLTVQEKQALWPLYENYMKELVKLFERRTALNKVLMDKQKTITAEQARAMVDEHLNIVSESVKLKKSMLAKLRKKLPDVKILKYFQVEVKIEAAYFYFLSKNIPLLK